MPITIDALSCFLYIQFLHEVLYLDSAVMVLCLQRQVCLRLNSAVFVDLADRSVVIVLSHVGHDQIEIPFKSVAELLQKRLSDYARHLGP